jgi:hypothetical protein
MRQEISTGRWQAHNPDRLPRGMARFLLILKWGSDNLKTVAGTLEDGNSTLSGTSKKITHRFVMWFQSTRGKEYRIMKKLLMLTAGVLAFCWPQLSQAQVKNEGLANQIIAARQKNAALMKQYSWNSRIEILDNGQVKDIRIVQEMYGPGGQLTQTTINDQPSPLPHGFLRKRIAEKEREKMEKYLKNLKKVLDDYTLPTSGKVIDFISQATITAPDANGMLTITGSNVVKPGDTMTMKIYAPTRHPRSMSITTFFEQDAVNVSATFKSLKNGLNYMGYGEADVPMKNLSLQVQNYDYFNQNQ